jgi:hypothetical protein
MSTGIFSGMSVHAHRRAGELDVDLHLDRLVERHLVEVGVQDGPAQRLALALLEDHLAARPAEVEVEERVLARGALQDGLDLFRRDGHRHGLPARPVEDAGDHPPAAQPSILVLSGLGPTLGGHHEFRHVLLPANPAI